MSSGPLDKWHETAGVRSGVRRIFREEATRGRVFFPARLVPPLAHPAVAALPRRRRDMLPLLHLYQFLLGTTHVETRVVNVAAERTANARCGPSPTAASRMSACTGHCSGGSHPPNRLAGPQHSAGAT